MAKEKQEICFTPELRKALMRESAREGGKSTSEAKRKAARKNIRNFRKKVKMGKAPAPKPWRFTRNGKTKAKA